MSSDSGSEEDDVELKSSNTLNLFFHWDMSFTNGLTKNLADPFSLSLP